MLRFEQEMIPGTRTPDRPSRWRARCIVADQAFEAASRNGACHELARVLVAAAVPDQPVELWNTARGYVALRWQSLHEMALWTFPGGNEQRVRYRENPFAAQRTAEGSADLTEVPSVASSNTRKPRVLIDTSFNTEVADVLVTGV